MEQLYYVAWEGQIFTCRLRTHVQVQGSGLQPGVWYALVAPAGVGWFPNHLVDGDGNVLIPSNVLRKTLEEARADVSIAALRRLGKGKST